MALTTACTVEGDSAHGEPARPGSEGRQCHSIPAIPMRRPRARPSSRAPWAWCRRCSSSASRSRYLALGMNNQETRVYDYSPQALHNMGVR
ncbi:hypothetical protein [Pseudomonas paralcaligenes]|uniref:hypothetical protein n=1 Tax=Pseudomonas paralcaligenes TaxID=2772558 RepID=UPI001C7E7F06|nr:hypothetical protein [Pseudomonas paralcaligenes]